MPRIIPEKTDIVQYTVKASKDIDKLDNKYLLEKLRSWAKIVNNYGVQEARKVKWYNDEALKGNRKGQRSIRLNRSYRAIYVESKNAITITVIEVNNHDY
jgi:proteic killer suppression protein